MILTCLQIYRELLSLMTFLRVYSNSREVSYLSWQITYSNLKTTCHKKLKFFLWTKLLENLLHAKYLISATAPLNLNYLLLLGFALEVFFLKKLIRKTWGAGLLYRGCKKQLSVKDILCWLNWIYNFFLTFLMIHWTC